MTKGLGQLSPEFTDHLVMTGTVASLMVSNPKYRMYPMAVIQAWIAPAIAHNQIKAFFDEKGRPVGYITWAFFDEETAHRWVNDPNVLLHFSEWNEGGELWILDFFARPGFSKIIRQHVYEDMFQEYENARSIRRRALSSTCNKVSVWRRSKA